ncbi:MAG: GAF domain-containing protein [Anaerolineales bacterium]|nr:GAF domain-containing protein [Anaerolineales bacterium]
MLTLALGSFFIFLLLQGNRQPTITIFNWLMLFVIIWFGGSCLSRVMAQAAVDNQLTVAGVWLLQVGFGGACIAVYIFAALVTGKFGLWTKLIAATSTILVVIYQGILTSLDVSLRYTIEDDGTLIYGFPRLHGLIYFGLAGGTLYLLWNNLSKIRQLSLRIGLILFTLGLFLGIASPSLRSFALPESTATTASAVMIYAMLQSQIIQPLIGRTRQIEAVQEVVLAITSRVSLDDVLQTIAAQAAELLGTAASAIYLRDDKGLILKAVQNLPSEFIEQTRLSLQQGVVGLAASSQESQLIGDYRREWKGEPDMPLAFETFGALLCVPLIFDDYVVGVLLVVEGIDGRLFDQEDMQLLQLLAPQAAVAIINSHLFEQERQLMSELLTAKTQLETVLLSTNNPVIALDRRLRIVFANPAAVALTASPDTQPRSVIYKSLLTYIDRSVLPTNLRSFVRDVHKTGSYVYEISLHRRDYFCHITQLTEPNRGWVIVLNDITTLKEVDRLKSQVVRMTSHDLKNPLFAIMTYLDLIEDDGEDIFTPDIRRNIQVLRTQLDRMQRLINGILDLERVGALTLETCDMRQLILSIVNGFEDIARTSQLILKTEVGEDLPLLQGDPNQLGQALANLIDNAIKYTPKGGTILVKTMVEDGHLAIAVSDTGIGIPEAYQAQVFDRFFRVKQGRSKEDIGSGLGLSLVKAVIEQHNGEVQLSSQEENGSTFTIILPLE